MSYRNIWKPKEAIDILERHQGSLLDVGGGISAYFKATHIIDSLPFDKERIIKNVWGGKSLKFLEEKNYSEIDLCSKKSWPFENKYFDLGLCSHTVEDLRDPISTVLELSRVCKKVLIITPSRLCEQTKGISHHGFCGFYHHPWIIYQKENEIIFRRKTFYLNSPRNHIVCPIDKRLKVEYGASYFYGEDFTAKEETLGWQKENEDYENFIAPYKNRRDIFEPKNMSIKEKIWYYKQKILNIY